VILLPPGTKEARRPSNWWPPEKAGWIEYWITFDGEIARRLLDNGVIAARPAILPAVRADSIKPVFEQLVARFREDPDGSPARMAADVLRLLALCLEGEPSPRGSDPSPAGAATVNGLVAEALSVIRSPGRESISVKELVDEMLIARRTLERAFRRHFGHGIHEEILRHRLERAKRLLADRSLDIEHVAARSGFGNVRTLRRVFTAAAGLSPRAYRESILTHPDAA
jgi:AraC-like DNA-binding protein